MKIKIGEITEDVLRMTNEIFKTTDSSERLTIELKDTRKSVAEIDELLVDNYSDSIIFIDDDDVEETFSGYVLDSVRKSCDDNGKRVSIEFKKQSENMIDG